jgi:transposase
MKYSGIDLHSNNSVVVVTDEKDHVLEEKRVPNDLAFILKLLEPHREDLAGVVVESTFNWYWLVDGLMDAGYVVKLALQAHVAVIATLSLQIEVIERRIKEQLVPRAEYRLLESVPGIGRTVAPAILLETGPIGRFADAGNYASYARCVESQHTSNGRKKGQGNTKNGNKYLAWAFIEAANFARRYHLPAKRFYEKKKARTNNVVATKALAHRLARACYHTLKEGKPFDVARWLV